MCQILIFAIAAAIHGGTVMNEIVQTAANAQPKLIAMFFGVLLELICLVSCMNTEL